MLELKDAVTAVVTPFKEDYSVDLEALDAYVRHVMSIDGVSGILTCGYSGEISSLNREEQLDIVSTVAKAVDGRVPVISGLQPTSTPDTIDFGRRLKSVGADVVQVNTPFYNILRRGLINNEDVVVKFFEDLAEGIDLPMTVFQYPPSTGVSYPASTIGRLAAMEHVVGIKEASPMETYEADYKAAAGQTAIFADNNTYTLIGMLLYGTEGSMVGIGNVGTHYWTKLYELSQSGDATETIKFANSTIRPLMDTFSRNLGNTEWSFVARVKEALVQMGLLTCGVVRPPEPAVTETDKAEIRNTLIKVGLVS